MLRADGHLLTSTELPKHQTKEEYAYNVLRTAILRCELKPGEKLVLDGLCAQLGVSPIPIRAALQRLQSEGLVEITPHTGTIVSELSPGNFEQVSMLLERLESLSFEVAARKATPDDIAHLRHIVEELDQVLVTKDMERWSELNVEFHRAAAAMTNMKLLIEFTNRALDSWTRLRRWYLPEIISQLPQAQAEHHAMVDMLVRRDIEGIHRVVTAHNCRLRDFAQQAVATLPTESTREIQS